MRSTGLSSRLLTALAALTLAWRGAPAWAQAPEEAPSQEAAPLSEEVPPEIGEEDAEDLAAPAEEPAPAGPPPWVPVAVQDRYVDNLPVSGPWPDGWSSNAEGMRGLPLIDVVSGDVLEAAQPVGDLALHGPFPPPVGLDSGDPGLGPTFSEGIGIVERAAPAPVEPVEPAFSPVPPPEEPPVAAPEEAGGEGLGLRLDHVLSPQPVAGGLIRAMVLLVLLVTLPLTTLSERLARMLSPTGLLPMLLRNLSGLARGATVLLIGALLVLALLALLDPLWNAALLLCLLAALAVAVGWSSRPLLADLFAGIVLVVENRVSPGERVEIDGFSGVVASLGPRALSLLTDDGDAISLPNSQVVRRAIRKDPDSFAPVVVPVHVPAHVRVGQVHQTLEELTLCSPYLAPSRPPNIFRDPDRDHVWRVEARLVDARYAKAFRSALVELADEVFHVADRPSREGGPGGPA